GEFKSSLKPQPGSSSVVQGPAADPGGIAYASVYFQTWRIRAVPLSAGAGPFYPPSEERAVSGDYPLSRFLYIYARLGKDAPPRPALEFLRFILSQQGQEIVARNGDYPLPAAVVDAQLRRLGDGTAADARK